MVNSEWRSDRSKGWHKDIGYKFEDELRKHIYQTWVSVSEEEPGWHPCTCGWEGYWSSFHSHVADHMRDVSLT